MPTALEREVDNLAAVDVPHTVFNGGIVDGKRQRKATKCIECESSNSGLASASGKAQSTSDNTPSIHEPCHPTSSGSTPERTNDATPN